MHSIAKDLRRLTSFDRIHPAHQYLGVDAVEIHATVRTTDRTGVEMEALTAVSVAALTVIDMVKAVDKGATITDVRVETKSGGKSEEWHR